MWDNKYAYYMQDDMPTDFEDVHEILPAEDNKVGGLYLGNLNGAKNIEDLKNKNVGAVISCLDKCEHSYPEDMVKEHKHVQILDHDDVKIRESFGDCHTFIDKYRNEGKSVLVHCSAGVSRSATIVISYILAKNPNYGIKFAYNFVGGKRPCILPNNGFIKQLEEYAIELEKANQ